MIVRTYVPAQKGLIDETVGLRHTEWVGFMSLPIFLCAKGVTMKKSSRFFVRAEPALVQVLSKMAKMDNRTKSGEIRHLIKQAARQRGLWPKKEDGSRDDENH